MDRRSCIKTAAYSLSLAASIHIAKAYSADLGATKNFDLQGHRGARGLLPENTLPAFDRALQLGVDTLELDIGVTRDGVVVVIHDRSLNVDIARGADGQWITQPIAINQLTFAQLQQYDVGRIKSDSLYAKTHSRQIAVDGTRIPSLAQLFEWVKLRGNTTVRFNIETKLSPLKPLETDGPQQMAERLIETIAEHGMHARCTIQSFDWRTLRISQILAPKIPTVYLTAQQIAINNLAQPSANEPSLWTAGLMRRDAESIASMVKRAGGSVWSPMFKEIDQADVIQAHSIGLKVIPWTVNTIEDMRRLISWGVDGLITDYPDLALGFKSGETRKPEP
jgi:glycerophosphoryl diester phosphodiesterase